MSTTNYPAARPLVDSDGKVVFLPTHVKYVIDGVSATNPTLKGPLVMGSTTVFGYENGAPKPLPESLGGTGTTSLSSLATSIRGSLGFNTSGVLQVAYGGTGVTSMASLATNLRTNLGFNSSGVLQVANGGTGVTTIANLASALYSSLGFTSAGVLQIAKGGTGSTSADAALTALGGASCVRYTANIPTASWTKATVGYTKAIAVSGVLQTDVPIAGLVLSDDGNVAKNQLTAAANIQRIVATANTITLYAYNTAPTTAFDIQLMCIRGYK